MPTRSERTRSRTSRLPRRAAALLALAVASSALLAVLPPVVVEAAASLPKIAAGSIHSLAIDDAGNVWAFGDNAFGQLGDGTTTRRTSPVMVYTATSSRKAVSVAAGDSHSLILMSDKTVWAFGANPSIALSTSSSASRILSAAPVRLENGGTMSNAVAVSAGGSSSAAILADGSAVVWGKGMRPTQVQLSATGSALKGLVGLSVGATQVLLLKSDGTVYQCDAATPSQAQPVLMHGGGGSVPLADVASVSAGKGFGMAVTRGGQLLSFGTNAYNVLGRDTGGAADPVAGPVLASAGGAPLSGVSAVDCGGDHAVALLGVGGLYGWGFADGGRLGRGQSGTVPYPVSIGLSGASEVATGGRHVLARSSIGVVWAFGANYAGQADGESTGTLDPHVVTMTTRIWQSLSPSIKASKVTETSFVITWRTADLYIDNVRGFLVRWSLPDGSTGETTEMPASVRSVLLGNLASGANHTVRVIAVGLTGNQEEAPPIVVQTIPATTPSISAGVSPDATPGDVTPGDVTPGDGTPAAPTTAPTLASEDMARKLEATYRRVLTDVLLAGIVLAVGAVALKVLAYRSAHRNLVEKDD